MPSVAVAYGGVGPGLFIELLQKYRNTPSGQAVWMLLRHARFVIVQAMSGRSQSNSFCQVRCNNMYCKSGDQFQAVMDKLPASQRTTALAESSAEWVRDHRALLQLSADIRAPTITRTVAFLYQCAASFDKRRDKDFPQYVSQEMVQEVLENLSFPPVVRSTFVEAVTTTNDPYRSRALKLDQCVQESCQSRGTRSCAMEYLREDCSCGSLWINYYPSSLLQWLTGDLLARRFLEEAPLLHEERVLEHAPMATSRRMTFFMLLTKGDASLCSRTPLASLETACKNHPHAQFFLYKLVGASVSIGSKLVDALAQHNCSVQQLEFNPATFFHGTPLEAWISANLEWVSSGRFWYSHATDLFRSAVLWRFGGWYLDYDVLVLRPLVHLRNCVAWQGAQGSSLVNNAISHFTKGHAFLQHVMEHIRANYNSSDWNSAGPGAVTRSLRTWLKKNCSEDECVTVFSNAAFFPLNWTFSNALFRQSASAKDSTVQLRLRFCF